MHTHIVYNCVQESHVNVYTAHQKRWWLEMFFNKEYYSYTGRISRYFYSQIWNQDSIICQPVMQMQTTNKHTKKQYDWEPGIQFSLNVLPYWALYSGSFLFIHCHSSWSPPHQLRSIAWIIVVLKGRSNRGSVLAWGTVAYSWHIKVKVFRQCTTNCQLYWSTPSFSHFHENTILCKMLFLLGWLI